MRITRNLSGVPMRCGRLLRQAMSRAGGLTALIAALALVAAPSARAAPVYPWCMIYQDMTGATACYYESYDQCRATAAGGNGGMCLQNPAFREQAQPEPRTSRKARRPR